MTAAPPPETARGSGVLILLPSLACLTGLLMQFRFMIFSGLGQIQGGLGDGRLVGFTLEHGYRWLLQIEPHQDFWKPPIFFPYPNASAFTDTMLGFAPLYWLPRLLGAAPDTALQWWTLIVYGLNFSAGYALLRKGPGLGILSSSAGALLVGIISVAWIGHLQLFPFFYVLLAMLALYRIHDTGDGAPGDGARRAWIGVFCACAVLQLWGGVYTFLFFGLLAALALIVSLSLRNVRPTVVQHLRRDAIIWILGLALSAAAVAPLVDRYGMTAEESGYRHYTTVNIPSAHSWILLPQQAEWLSQRQVPISPDFRSKGIGLLTFGVGLAGLRVRRRLTSVQVLGIATLMLMLLGTRYGDFSPWRLIYEIVPGAGAIRAHHRLTMIVIPAAVIGVALACEAALRRRRWLLAVLLVAVCIGERSVTQKTIDKQFVRDHVLQVAERVDPGSEAFLLLPTNRDARWVADDAAAVALATGTPAVNGRYGNFPDSYGIRRLIHPSEEDPDRRKLKKALAEWLDKWGVDPDGVQLIEYEGLTKEATKPYRSRLTRR